MSKNRAKLLIALAGVAVGFLGVLLAVIIMGRIVLRFGSGADFSAALNVIPEAPSDMAERLIWLPDATPPDMRELTPYERTQISGAYLNAWAQLAISHELGYPYGLRTYWGDQARAAASRSVTETVAAGWQVSQSALRHALSLTFFSDDGSIVAFTDRDAHVVRYLRQPESDLEEVIETSGRYEVIMLLEDGNWRIRHLVYRGEGERVDLQQVAVDAPANGPVPEPVIVDNGRFTRDGAPFAMAGVNYYPQATPWTRFWPEYDSVQTAADFAVARGLGFNTIRIFIPFEDFGGAELDSQMLARLLDLMDRAEGAGLLVLVTLFDHRTDHHPANWAADDRHIAALVPALADHPALFGWDIKNEPDRDDAAASSALVDAWLRHVAEEVRRHDPVHPLTIGWSTIESAERLTDVTDFISYHFYGDPAAYGAKVQALQAVAGDQPLVLQEFGMSTWNTLFPGGHTEREQAALYADLLRQNQALGVAGHMAWTLFDFADVPLGEFYRPWERGVQAHFGLVRRDGTHKPAAALAGVGASLDARPVSLAERLGKPFNAALLLGSLTLLIAATRLLNRRRSPK